MTPIQKIFAGLSDAELRAIVRDLKALDDTGIWPEDGPSRALTHRIARETGTTFNDARHIVQQEPLRIAAFKWAEQQS